MDSEKRKAMIDAYKRSEAVGGIYCVECTGNHKKWIKSTKDLESIRNRFNFSISINSAPEPSMREEWDTYGRDFFVFTVLEQLKKTKEQTDREYADELAVLLDMCKERAGRDEG